MNTITDVIKAVEFDHSLWKVGDIVTRGYSDEHEIFEINLGCNQMEVRCIKEPVMENGEEPWIKVGTEEGNMMGRYSWLRGGKI